MTHRLEKLNSLIQQELSKIIARELEWPDGYLVAITEVEISEDLKQAKVFVSVLPSTGNNSALRLLNQKARNLQKLLNKKLIMHSVPHIKFFPDTGQSKVEQLENLLDKISNAQ